MIDILVRAYYFKNNYLNIKITKMKIKLIFFRLAVYKNKVNTMNDIIRYRVYFEKLVRATISYHIYFSIYLSEHF